MASLYTNNMLGFLSTRPGVDEEDRQGRGSVWETDLPLDEVHREAVQLGLVESAGRAKNSNTADRGSRPFRLTSDGLSLRESALAARRKPGDEGPLLVDYLSEAPEMPEDNPFNTDTGPSKRDGLIAVFVFVVLVSVAWAAVEMLR